MILLIDPKRKQLPVMYDMCKIEKGIKLINYEWMFYMTDSFKNVIFRRKLPLHVMHIIHNMMLTKLPVR